MSGLRHLHSIIPLSPANGGIIRKVINPCSAVLETIYSKVESPAHEARVGMEIASDAMHVVGRFKRAVICFQEGTSLSNPMETVQSVSSDWHISL